MDRPGAPGRPVSFFIGKEVEHTPCWGAKTLFVVGLQKAEKIFGLTTKHKVNHIFLGANRSFNPKDDDEILEWAELTMKGLEAGFWVTLDFDVRWTQTVHDFGVMEEARFIPLISIQVPKVRDLGRFAVFKLDDTAFNGSNGGVWCFSVPDILRVSHGFTAWDAYKQDQPLD
jgi:hypothetical protein